MAVGTYQFQSDFAKRYYGQGLAAGETLGRAGAVVTILETRGRRSARRGRLRRASPALRPARSRDRADVSGRVRGSRSRARGLGDPTHAPRRAGERGRRGDVRSDGGATRRPERHRPHEAQLRRARSSTRGDALRRRREAGSRPPWRSRDGLHLRCGGETAGGIDARRARPGHRPRRHTRRSRGPVRGPRTALSSYRCPAGARSFGELWKAVVDGLVLPHGLISPPYRDGPDRAASPGGSRSNSRRRIARGSISSSLTLRAWPPTTSDDAPPPSEDSPLAVPRRAVGCAGAPDRAGDGVALPADAERGHHRQGYRAGRRRLHLVDGARDARYHVRPGRVRGRRRVLRLQGVDGVRARRSQRPLSSGHRPSSSISRRS
jgi:hypothetical protein